jgi:hypothetical protein
MVDQDWPEELLQHELGEELSVWGRGADGKMKNKTLARGEVQHLAKSPLSLCLERLINCYSISGHKSSMMLTYLTICHT